MEPFVAMMCKLQGKIILIILHVAHLLHLWSALPIVLYLPMNYYFTRNVNLFLQCTQMLYNI